MGISSSIKVGVCLFSLATSVLAFAPNARADDNGGDNGGDTYGGHTGE